MKKDYIHREKNDGKHITVTNEEKTVTNEEKTGSIYICRNREK